MDTAVVLIVAVVSFVDVVDRHVETGPLPANVWISIQTYVANVDIPNINILACIRLLIKNVVVVVAKDIIFACVGPLHGCRPELIDEKRSLIKCRTKIIVMST